MAIDAPVTKIHVAEEEFYMANGDSAPLAFNAEEAVVTAEATMVRLGSTPPVPSNDLVGAVAVTATGVTVIVTGGARGGLYELKVTFINAAGRRWSRLLNIHVV